MAERPLYTLYKNLKAQNYDVPDDYNKFESALTRDGKGGADNRHAIYENLKAQNFDVPSTYERFYSALFEPRSKTSSRAKGGSVPMSAADRARFSAGAAAISASAQQTMNNAGRYNRLKQRKQKQQKAFGRVNLGTHQTPYGGDANNVVKDDFAYNPETGKAGAYVTSDNENVYSQNDAEQMQAILDKQNDAYQVAVDTGEIPSAFDVRDKNGNYDLQENIGKNGTYLTEEGAQKQFDKKLADAYARKKEIETLIAEDNRQHGNPLLSYNASIGASNGRTAEQSDYRNKLATSLSLVTEQIGALEAVKQYPTSSWGEDALKALDNTAFTAKTWDFGLTDFAIMGQMERIKTKMDNNIPLSSSDKMLLKSKLGADAATALEDEKMGNVYRWTKIAGQSLPFMADFFLTGGYGGITKGISRGALKFAAKRGMGKVSAAILKNTGIVAGDVIGSYAMAGTEQALKTGADIMQRHLGNLYQDEKGDYKFGTFDENGNLLHEGGESIGTALYKGMTSAMVENYTEKLFGHNYGIKKGAVNFMEKHGMNASAEFFKNIGKSGWYTNSKKWMEKFGINGFAEEVMEEEIGIPLHALLDGEGKVSDLLDAKQQLDIIGGMAISVGSMYAMGAGSRPVKGIYNRAQYYRFRNKVNVADSDALNLMGDNWADIKDKIDNATNEQMGGVLADILRQRDTMTKEQINAAVNYGINLMKMRGYNIAKTAEMNAKEITNEPTTPEEQHQADIDNAYSEGHDADDADKHDIQIQQEDQMKTLAAALDISEQQLSAMSDEELESLTGQDDKLDQAIYDYQLSSARYQGVVGDAQDKVDLAAHQAEQRVDMYTDQSRGSVRNATIKASGGLEDYGVYIISGNIATHDDGSIDVSNSDDMILYYDPTTNSVEHADALMFAELGEELPADEVKAQAVADAKENAIKEVAGIIDGTIEVGSQFNVTGADGMEHTYEVLADYGDGTAAISIDGNVVENPYSLADLQQMKDLEDQKRLETAKAEREQMEKERAAQQNEETEQTEETQPSFDFNQILNDNGNVVLADVLGKDGNTKYPNSQLFLIRDSGAKAKVVELKSDGTLVPHAVNKKDVRTATTMTLDEYKQAFADSSMIEDNSGEESDEDSQLANLGLPKGSKIWMSGDGFGRPKENTLSRVVGIDEQGSIVLEDKDGKKWSASFDYINNHRELPPLDENANIVNEENNQSESNAEENTPAPEQTPAMTLEDGTIVPMLEDGNPDFSKLSAAQTAELYDSQFGEDADSIVSGYVSDAKKALDKASNMTVKGKTFVEQKAAKDTKEKAIADAQAAYDSAIAIRDAYNERQLAKVEDTAEGRKELIEKARRKFARLKSAVKDDAEAVSQLYRETIGSLLHRLYDGTGIDVTDTIPLTAEEYVASNLGAHSLNYEGTETSKGVKQETGLSREDFAKTQLLAADGKGTTIDALVHSLWENRPSNLESLDTQDIRNALIGVLNSGFKASEARNFVENIRIAQAENILEEQKRAQENAAYAEQHKAEPEAELKAKSDEKAELKAKSEAKLDNESDNKSNDLSNESDNENINDNINDNINTLTPEQQKAKEDGEKLGFPAVDKEGEPINEYVVELAEWAKEQGLEIDPTSKLNSYADLFLMCKDGFGVSTLVPDEGENINQVVYFPDNVQDFDQLWKLQEEFNAGRDLKHSSNIDSEITEGATFYDADTAREFKEFVDKKVEEQNKVFGEQKSEEDLPFSAKENSKQQTAAERAADVEKNKVDDMKVVDNIVGQKTRKAFERLAKMMGANIQWQYSDKLGNGWIQETKDADGNVHRTIFITLDSSIKEGAQFIFGHEMTHQIKNLNPAAYNELTQLVLDTYGSDAFDKAVDETMQRYSDAGFSGRARDYYAEEVVADAVGEMIRDLNLAHTLAMKMSHPLLAAIHEILQKIKLAFFGTEYSDVTKNIIRSIEQAYVKTAKGEVTNSETGEDVSFSLRQKPEPKKKGVGYKVFVLKDGKLYPPMVANPDGAATPVGVWLDADAAPIAGESKTGRPQVKQGGKGTQGGSGKLAYRPGWHLGVVPYAIQFNRKDADGNKTLFPKNFVFAEVEYAADVDYQEEARQEGINPSGKYQHSLAGLKHLPTDGYYMYRTNPNSETDPWVITGAMKVNRILTRAEQADLVSKAGREPQQIQEGDIVTDDVVNSVNQEIADAPKFSLKVYHGSGADFTEFDFDHMGEGAGSQVFGWGGYVTSSKKIGKSYATLMDNDPSKAYYRIQRSNGTRFAKKYPTLESFLHGDKQIAMNDKFTEQEKIDFYNEMKKLAEPYHNLYEVDIPEDNGSNYLEWEEKPSDEVATKIIEGLYGLDAKTLDDMASKDIVFRTLLYDYIKNADKEQMIPNLVKTHALTRGTTYDNGNVEDDIRFVYNRLSRWMGSQKAASQFLSSLGFTGIKYPAGTIMGGAEENDTNYVIFKPEDMRIIEHTKFSLRLKSAIEETETNPSDAQKESGNYKKGHIKFGGYDYTIENPKGSTRSGKDADGKEWKVTMHDTYGYIRGKFGKDGDHLDMFINDKADLDNWNGDVFVVDQVNPDGSFDEHKVMYGYDSMDDAKKAYLANYSDGWQGLGNITGASKDEFDKWLDTSNRKLKPFADYAKVKFSLKDIKPVGVGAFGNIYNQFRGKSKAAIEFLKKLGSGEATAALHHHTIGDISLVWGDKKTGLDKILRKHPEVVDNLQSIIDSMEVVQESDNRIKLESPTHFAVVSKEYKGEPREQWLLTAYEKRESLENGKSMDTATSSLGGDTALSQSKESAAKIDNSSETAKENGEKFSLKDEKTLAGVHNISEEKLLKAIKQGGLANPSVAVIDSSRQDHKAYGGISLILPSDKIAKRTGKNAGTWQGDAYTPTYPEVEKQMSNKGAEKSSSDVLSVPKEMQHEVRNGIDRWLNGGDANSGLKYLFLHEKGVAPEPKMIQPKFSDEAYNELKFITAGDFNIYGIGKADAQKVLDMYIEAKFDGDKDLYEEKTKAWLERNKSIVDAGAKGGMRYAIAKENVELYDEYGFNYKGVQTFVRDVEYDHRKSGVDTNATLNDVEDYIKTNNLTDEFNTWLEGKEKEYGIKEVIFDGFTPSGNRRYVPNTLENVSKLMKKQGRNGATGTAVSFQNFVARLMPSYGTLKDIRSKKDLLTSDREEFDKFREKWSDVFYELGMKCQPDATGTFDDYGLARLSEAAMTSDPQAYLKKEYNVDFSDADTKRLKDMVKAIKEEHPAMYFETKFERPVRFDEFSAAVVPTTTKKEVKEALKNAGVSIFEYDEKSDADRKRAFNEAINSSDNIRFSLAGERGAADMAEDLKSLNTPDEVDDAIKTAIDDMPSGWKMANKKMIHIAQALGENRKAEIAGEEPKFSLKDGTLIKAGTYFSGGGLVEEGLKGIIDPVVAVEYDEKISGVYRNNFGQHIVTADVRDVDPKELVKQIDGEVEYFHASPVCKNYSQAKSNHAEVELDKETAASTAEFINAIKPKVVTIENVKGYKDSEAMKIITDALDANGYTWDADVYNAADYGGYTNRERLIVRAVRDGKLPEKPKKMARKSGWYEAVADIIPTLTEKKNGVAPWMDIRLKADGIDWRNIDKPLYVMGSAYADGKVPHAFADELLPTLRTKSGDVIVMPDGKVYRAMGRVLARVSGVSDDYKMPFSENLSHTIIGNGIPTQLTEHVIAPLLTGSDPKFSIRTYHGTGASFDKFDLSHALEGEGSESFGHGVYVTNSSKIGREYAQRAKNRKMEDLYKNMRYPDGVKGDIFKRRVFGEMVNDVATGGSVASAKEFAKKRVGADANDIQRTLENLKDREKGTEYEQNLKDRLAEYKEGLNWIDSLDEDYLTQGNVNRYDVDIPDDNGSNYLDWEGTIPDSLDKQKVAEDAYKVVSDNQGFNDFKATPLNDFIAHTLKTYVNTTDVAGRVEKLKSDIKDVIENYVADDDVLALNEYLKDATPDDVLATIWYNDLVRDIKDADLGEELYRKLSTYVGDNAASQILSDNGLVGIKYPAGMIHGGAKEGDYNYVIFDENNANIVGNTRFSLRYDQFEHDLNQWKKDNNLPKDAKRPTIPQRNAGESAVDFLKRVDEYRKQMALWKTAPTYEQHLLSNDTALGEFNRELQRGSVLKRIAFQDSMLAIRKAQEAIMKEVGVDRLNMAEDAYTAENRSHGKGKNEFEEYNNEFLQPLRKAYHQMKKILGDSYDNVRIYMMAKHGLERDAQMAFKKSLEADYEDVAQRSAAYKAYKGDMNRIINDSDLEFGRVDFTTWRQRNNALRAKYSPSYMNYRYDKNGIAYDYSGLSALFDGSDFEEAAYKLVKDIEDKYVTETHDLWDATNAATKKILRDGYKAGMMSKNTYQYVRDMYSHYIPLRGWDGTTADQVWDYIGGGKGAFNQTLKKAHGRTSIADDPIAYIENMAESGILLNNKNWVKQHLMLLAQNHPTSLLTLSKAWYVKSVDDNGNEEWIPATPQITSQMDSNQVKAAIDAFEKKMEQMAQTGDATQKREGLNIAYPQTHSEEREHEVRVMKDGEEYVIYVNGDPQLAQAMNNTRAHRVREIQSGKLDRAAAWLGRKMAAAYTSLSPLFIPSNYFRDLTMTLASTAIRENAKYNYLLRKNLATSWNLGFMLRDYQNGKLREKVSNGNATPKERMFYDFMMNGGETGFVSSLDVEDLKKKFKNDLKDLDRWKANPVKVGHTIMDGIEFLNRAIEDSNRFAVYMTSIQYGRSIDEAVNDAKDVTLNFNRKGTGEYGWQMVRNLYLFINPAVQSLQTLGALAKHHPFKFTAVTASWLASGVLVPIVNAALMSMLGGDDDKDKYWQFTKWDRRNNLIMWVPFTHEYVKIPLAQEFRAFYGIGDMIASKMMGGELAEESWSQYAEDLLGQVVDMLPLDPTGYDGNIAVSLMPNAIRPVFELAFNIDFTGKPLFKDTEYNKYDPNFTKAYVGTPDWLVRASKMVNSIGNDYPDVQQNSIDAFGDPRYNLNNPAVVDHVLSSYLGGAYTMGSQVLGLLTKSLNDPKEIKVADIPLFSKFVSNPDDRPVTKKQGDEFWDMKENHDRAANTLSKLKKQAKVDGDYSMLERFYGSEEYKQYKQDDAKVKKYEEDKKKERAEESGEEYRHHKLNAEDIYKAHATPKDDFEDLKLKQLYTKLNGFKTSYDLLVDTAPSQSDGYYNTNKAAIDAIDEISLDKQEISELKKGFLDDGKDAYNAEDMKEIRELRKKILSVLEKANKVVVANQKAKAEK
jgi:site-specific DNA-cytosine methylase